jgi:membrane protein insertase Oxa1/YidC/SpoIIIJ
MLRETPGSSLYGAHRYDVASDSPYPIYWLDPAGPTYKLAHAVAKASADVLSAVHDATGLPWWATVVGFALAVRTLTLPVNLASLRNSSRLADAKEDLTSISRAYHGATARLNALQAPASDRLRAARTALQAMCHAFSGAKFKPWAVLLAPLTSIPILLGGSLGARHSVLMGDASWEQEGMLWFRDLTVTDPYFVMPMLALASSYAALDVAFGRRKPTGRTSGVAHMLGFRVGNTIKEGIQLLMIASVPWTVHVPAGMFLLLTVNSLFTIAYVKLVRDPSVYRRLTGRDAPQQRMSAAVQLAGYLEEAAGARKAAAAAAASAAAAAASAAGQSAPAYLDQSITAKPEDGSAATLHDAHKPKNGGGNGGGSGDGGSDSSGSGSAPPGGGTPPSGPPPSSTAGASAASGPRPPVAYVQRSSALPHSAAAVSAAPCAGDMLPAFPGEGALSALVRGGHTLPTPADRAAGAAGAASAALERPLPLAMTHVSRRNSAVAAGMMASMGGSDGSVNVTASVSSSVSAASASSHAAASGAQSPATGPAAESELDVGALLMADSDSASTAASAPVPPPAMSTVHEHTSHTVGFGGSPVRGSHTTAAASAPVPEDNSAANATSADAASAQMRFESFPTYPASANITAGSADVSTDASATATTTGSGPAIDPRLISQVEFASLNNIPRLFPIVGSYLDLGADGPAREASDDDAVVVLQPPPPPSRQSPGAATAAAGKSTSAASTSAPSPAANSDNTESHEAMSYADFDAAIVATRRRLGEGFPILSGHPNPFVLRLAASSQRGLWNDLSLSKHFEFTHKAKELREAEAAKLEAIKAEVAKAEAAKAEAAKTEELHTQAVALSEELVAPAEAKVDTITDSMPEASAADTESASSSTDPSAVAAADASPESAATTTPSSGKVQMTRAELETLARLRESTKMRWQVASVLPTYASPSYGGPANGYARAYAGAVGAQAYSYGHSIPQSWSVVLGPYNEQETVPGLLNSQSLFARHKEIVSRQTLGFMLAINGSRHDPRDHQAVTGLQQRYDRELTRMVAEVVHGPLAQAGVVQSDAIAVTSAGAPAVDETDKSSIAAASGTSGSGSGDNSGSSGNDAGNAGNDGNGGDDNSNKARSLGATIAVEADATVSAADVNIAAANAPTESGIAVTIAPSSDSDSAYTPDHGQNSTSVASPVAEIDVDTASLVSETPDVTVSAAIATAAAPAIAPTVSALEHTASEAAAAQAVGDGDLPGDFLSDAYAAAQPLSGGRSRRSVRERRRQQRVEAKAKAEDVSGAQPGASDLASADSADADLVNLAQYQPGATAADRRPLPLLWGTGRGKKGHHNKQAVRLLLDTPVQTRKTRYLRYLEAKEGLNADATASRKTRPVKKVDVAASSKALLGYDIGDEIARLAFGDPVVESLSFRRPATGDGAAATAPVDELQTLRPDSRLSIESARLLLGDYFEAVVEGAEPALTAVAAATTTVTHSDDGVEAENSVYHALSSSQGTRSSGRSRHTLSTGGQGLAGGRHSHRRMAKSTGEESSAVHSDAATKRDTPATESHSHSSDTSGAVLLEDGTLVLADGTIIMRVGDGDTAASPVSHNATKVDSSVAPHQPLAAAQGGKLIEAETRPIEHEYDDMVSAQAGIEQASIDAQAPAPPAAASPDAQGIIAAFDSAVKAVLESQGKDRPAVLALVQLVKAHPNEWLEWKDRKQALESGDANEFLRKLLGGGGSALAPSASPAAADFSGAFSFSTTGRDNDSIPAERESEAVRARRAIHANVVEALGLILPAAVQAATLASPVDVRSTIVRNPTLIDPTNQNVFHTGVGTLIGVGITLPGQINPRPAPSGEEDASVASPSTSSQASANAPASAASGASSSLSSAIAEVGSSDAYSDGLYDSAEDEDDEGDLAAEAEQVAELDAVGEDGTGEHQLAAAFDPDEEEDFDELDDMEVDAADIDITNDVRDDTLTDEEEPRAARTTRHAAPAEATDTTSAMDALAPARSRTVQTRNPGFRHGNERKLDMSQKARYMQLSAGYGDPRKLRALSQPSPGADGNAQQPQQPARPSKQRESLLFSRVSSTLRSADFTALDRVGITPSGTPFALENLTAEQQEARAREFVDRVRNSVGRNGPDADTLRRAAVMSADSSKPVPVFQSSETRDMRTHRRKPRVRGDDDDNDNDDSNNTK